MLILKPQVERLTRYVWSTELTALRRWQARALWTLRFVYVLLRDLTRDRISLRATSLVYITLLSLVPILAVSVSVLKSIGIHRQFEPILMDFFKPLGDKGHELGLQIITFVNNLEVGVLGGVGLALVIYTGIKLLHETEQAFNEIWHVERARSLWRRFSEYLAVLLVGPVLMVIAVSITASVMSTTIVLKLLDLGFIGVAIATGGKLLSSALVMIMLTAAYAFVPNTQVRFGAALTGGIIAGVAWELAGWAFGSLMVYSTTYAVLYSSFAIIILFFVWLYVSWSIVLVGASIAYYIQNLDEVARRETDAMNINSVGERLLLTVMWHIGRAFAAGNPGWTHTALAHKCDISSNALEPVMHVLIVAGWVSLTTGEPARYQPAKALDKIEIAQLWSTAYTQSSSDTPEVATLLKEVDAAVMRGLHGTTLHDWVSRSNAAPT